MPHPGSYRSALSTGLAAGVVLSSVWVRVQAGKGIRNTYDSSFFLGCDWIQQTGTSFGT